MKLTCNDQAFAGHLRLGCAALVLLAFGVGQTQAQSVVTRAEAPAVKVGDRWKYEQADRRTGVKESEFDRRVTSVSATSIEGTENDGKLVMTPELGVVESSTVVISGESKPLSFPLEVGKKWEYKYNYSNKVSGNIGRWQLDASVVAVEKVKVPAGEFDAFRIEYKGFWNNDTAKRNGPLKVTNWYAPATRSIVKTEYDDGRASWVRHLVEFQVQP